MPRLPTALLLIVATALVAACDNVGRAFDPDVDNPNPPGQPTTSNVQVPPAGGDLRDGRPLVRAAYPKGGGWPATVPVVVEFSESMNQASIAPTTPGGLDGRVVLRIEGTTQALPAAYDFLAGGRLLVLRPITSLVSPQGAGFEVAMLPGVRDADGLAFTGSAEQILASFTIDTESTSEDGGILAVYPRDNVRDVSTDSEFIVVFTKAANPTPFANPANFLVRTSAGTAVAGLPDAPLQPADARVARFRPAAGADFAAGTTFELVVTAGITFGTAGVLRFSGRTPFTRFTTATAPQPLNVTVGPPPGNPPVTFPDKVNIANLPTLQMSVGLPADVAAGDRVIVRVYGSDRETQATGDLAFEERSVQLAAGGAQTAAIDFTGRLGSVANARFDDGALSFSAQVQRGAVHSGIVLGATNAKQDTVRPTLTSLAQPVGANGTDLYCELEHLVVFGTASEQLGDVRLVLGSQTVNMFASRANGTFVTAPVAVGRLTASQRYSLAIFDLAGNEAPAPAEGDAIQRGRIGGDGTAGDLVVEAYDEATLRPVAGATVLVDSPTPVVPADPSRQVATTDAAGRATFTGLPVGAHTVSLLLAGFDGITLYATPAGFVSLPLRPTAPTTALSAIAGTATLDGTLANATVIVGSNLLDDPVQPSIQTQSSAPTVIPPTPTLPNRLQVVTAFGGVFEPTSNPTFAFHSCNLLTGTDLDGPAPPTVPVAAGAAATQALLLRNRGGNTDNLAPLTDANGFQFAVLTGLNLSNLTAPVLRFSSALDGFRGQAVTGIGFATVRAPGSFDATGSYSTAILDGLGPYSPRTWLMLQVEDNIGQLSRIRRRVDAATGSGTEFVEPQWVPSIDVPTGPSVGPPFVRVFDAIGTAEVFTAFGVNTLGLVEVSALDTTGRQWRMLVEDVDVRLRTDFDDLQYPDPGSATGLAAGIWIVRASSRLFQRGTRSVGDYLLADVRREELSFARSSPITFTVQ